MITLQLKRALILIVFDSVEECDVIVDDVSIGNEPGFRDGVVSEAVDQVVADGSLYFSSAGNYRNGYRFTSVRLLIPTGI